MTYMDVFLATSPHLAIFFAVLSAGLAGALVLNSSARARDDKEYERLAREMRQVCQELAAAEDMLTLGLRGDRPIEFTDRDKS